QGGGDTGRGPGQGLRGKGSSPRRAGGSRPYMAGVGSPGGWALDRAPRGERGRRPPERVNAARGSHDSNRRSLPEMPRPRSTPRWPPKPRSSPIRGTVSGPPDHSHKVVRTYQNITP